LGCSEGRECDGIRGYYNLPLRKLYRFLVNISKYRVSEVVRRSPFAF